MEVRDKDEHVSDGRRPLESVVIIPAHLGGEDRITAAVSIRLEFGQQQILLQQQISSAFLARKQEVYSQWLHRRRHQRHGPRLLRRRLVRTMTALGTTTNMYYCGQRHLVNNTALNRVKFYVSK